MRVDPVGGAVEKDGDEERQQMGKASSEIEPGMVRWEGCRSRPMLRHPFPLRYQPYNGYKNRVYLGHEKGG